MAKLTPYFYSEDARVQAEFYVKALGGEIHDQILMDKHQARMKQ